MGYWGRERAGRTVIGQEEESVAAEKRSKRWKHMVHFLVTNFHFITYATTPPPPFPFPLSTSLFSLLLRTHCAIIQPFALFCTRDRGGVSVKRGKKREKRKRRDTA